MCFLLYGLARNELRAKSVEAGWSLVVFSSSACMKNQLQVYSAFLHKVAGISTVPGIEQGVENIFH